MIETWFTALLVLISAAIALVVFAGGVVKIAPDDTPDRELTGGTTLGTTPIIFRAGQDFAIANGNAPGGTTHTITFTSRAGGGASATWTEIIQPGQKFSYSGRGIASITGDSADSNVTVSWGPRGTIFGGQLGPLSAAGSGLAATVSIAGIANPTAVATTKMLGLGADFQFTPAKTGIVLVCIRGQLVMNTTGGTNNVGCQVTGKYGLVSGGVPANGAATAGTTFATGNTGPEVDSSTGELNDAYCDTCIIAVLSLTAGVAYWFDEEYTTANGVTGLLANVSGFMMELGQ
jgi:hypothetical protein